MKSKCLISMLAALFLSVALLCPRGAAATPLTWDPSQNGSGAAGNGNWDTTAGNTVWYNGASDVLWSQTSGTVALNGATFNGPDAAPGTYAVSVMPAKSPSPTSRSTTPVTPSPAPTPFI